MTTATATIEVPNAIIFLFDHDDASVQIPKYAAERLVSANQRCISIGTRAQVDGDVSITLADQISDDIAGSAMRAFVGTIYAPNLSVSVVTSDDRCVLKTKIDRPTASVEIWANDVKQPSKIFILVD